MTAPAKKAPKKAAPKRSPRAAKVEAPHVGPELSDEELAELAADMPSPAEGEIRPVIIGKRGRRGDKPVEMVTLFELDDVPYQIPRNPSAALVLRWMLDIQEYGTKGAAANMGITLLGRPALDALAASPEVEPEDVADIFTNLATVFFTSDTWKKIQAAPDPS